ncbi:MAG: DUF5320 domain-containing protein [Methanomicrobium sp.]|nr:DUF5320 domain-containing protein [Methanomicrobium sp.]
MAGFNGTGPRGLGRMTGRKFGPCNTEYAAVGSIKESEGDITGGSDKISSEEIIYGIGRGGVPRGCGQGFCGGRGRRGNPRR